MALNFAQIDFALPICAKVSADLVAAKTCVGRERPIASHHQSPPDFITGHQKVKAVKVETFDSDPGDTKCVSCPSTRPLDSIPFIIAADGVNWLLCSLAAVNSGVGRLLSV